MRSILLLSCFCYLFTVARASIVKGFATKEGPSLEELPTNIAEHVRNLFAASGRSRNVEDRKLEQQQSSSANHQTRQAQAVDANGGQQFPIIPEAPADFNTTGELSFVIVSIATDSNEKYTKSFPPRRLTHNLLLSS